MREGKIFFAHPLKYVVKPGDTLSRISFSVTGGKASVSNLKRWNSLSGDTIYPGQEFFIANPDDELVNKMLWDTSSSTWKSRNPSIEIEKLGPELAGKYTGRNKEQYLVKLVLKYDESAEHFLNPNLFNFELPERIPALTDRYTPVPPKLLDFDDNPNNQPRQSKEEGGNTLSTGVGWFSTLSGVTELSSDISSAHAYKLFQQNPVTFVQPSGSLLEVTDHRLVKRLMNAKKPLSILANSNLGTAQTLKMFASGAKWTGVGGSIAGIGIAGYNIASGQGTGWDYADLAVNGGAIVLTFITVSTPVGWVAGGVILAYNGFRLYQSYSD